MFCAFAVDKEKRLAPTLGKAEFLLILDRNGKEIDFQQIKTDIYTQLQKTSATHLFCGGIGNCSCMLLESTGMELLYGCEENSLPAELLKDFLHHTLKQEKECFCTSCGRSCGECPGKF